MKRLDHDNPPTLNDFGVLVQVKNSIRLRYQSATKKRKYYGITAIFLWTKIRVL